MKAQSRKHLLIGSTALATAIAGSSAMAASQGGNPFASETTHAGSLKTAEMACGAGQCGSSMDEEKDGEKEEGDDDKS